MHLCGPEEIRKKAETMCKQDKDRLSLQKTKGQKSHRSRTAVIIDTASGRPGIRLTSNTILLKATVPAARV